MLRKYALTVVFLFVVCGAAAQLPDDEYYPYGTGYEQRTPIVLTDSSLFYRAIQTMPDLYGSISAFNLPYIALGRRGQHYSSEAASFSGLGISSRYFGSLRLLGAREERRAGIAALPEAIGGAGGVRTFCFAGALAEPSYHASVSFTDRNYLAGAKLAFARPAGHGWDVAAAVEARTGRDMHVEGVFTNALTAGFRAARHLGEGHTLGFLLIVPPSVRGTRLSSVEEAFRLTGDNLYNPAWGFQDGKVRNSRVRREFVPLAAATYCVRLSPATWLDMAAGAEYGVRKYSALGWYDARTPMPDNYRYLPGYTGDRETELAWRSNDARYTQVCWDELIARNRMAGGHAVYTLEDRAERIRNFGFDALFTTAPDERLTLRYGFSYRHARTRSYKQMRDLLGADHITDIDQYLVDDDTYGNLLQNDLRHPGRTVREGDRFGYDYALSTREATVRLSAEYRSDRLRADVALALGDAVVLRRGYYEKELFPGTQSLGRSRRMGFTPYTVKALVGWAFSPRSYLEASAAAGAAVPDAADLFYQPLYNNRTVDDPAAGRFYAAELNFTRTGERLSLRITAFAVATMASSPAVITTIWQAYTATWPLRASDAWPAAWRPLPTSASHTAGAFRSPLRAGGTNISVTRASRSSPTSTIRPSTPVPKATWAVVRSAPHLKLRLAPNSLISAPGDGVSAPRRDMRGCVTSSLRPCAVRRASRGRAALHRRRSMPLRTRSVSEMPPRSTPRFSNPSISAVRG